MIPFLIVAAAALLLEGCWKSEEPKKQPLVPSPKPETAPESSPSIVVSPPIFETAEGSEKPTPEQLQELIKGMRACLEVQKSYGTTCPPPEKLPRGCSCEQVQLPRALDPETPIRFKREMNPETPANKGLMTL